MWLPFQLSNPRGTGQRCKMSKTGCSPEFEQKLFDLMFGEDDDGDDVHDDGAGCPVRADRSRSRSPSPMSKPILGENVNGPHHDDDDDEAGGQMVDTCLVTLLGSTQGKLESEMPLVSWDSHSSQTGNTANEIITVDDSQETQTEPSEFDDIHGLPADCMCVKAHQEICLSVPQVCWNIQGSPKEVLEKVLHVVCFEASAFYVGIAGGPRFQWFGGETPSGNRVLGHRHKFGEAATMEILWHASARNASKLEKLVIAHIKARKFHHFANKSDGGECQRGHAPFFVYVLYVKLQVRLPDQDMLESVDWSRWCTPESVA